MADPPPSSEAPPPPNQLQTPAQQLASQHTPALAPTQVETAPEPIVTAESLVDSVGETTTQPAPTTAAPFQPVGSSTPPVPLDPSGTRPASVAEQQAPPVTISDATRAPSASLAPPMASTASEATPPSSEGLGARRRSVTSFSIPPQLIKPGVEMLKVSRKSARRVKPRKMWLEVGSDTPEDGEMGLEVGFGMVGGQDVRLCWEKNGLGIGLSLKKEASVPLSRIKDLRFGTQGSPYRTSLQISKEVEPRWITVIYTVPPSSRQVLNSAVNYKLVHFIAPTVELVELWKTTLERFKEGRVAKGVAAGELPHEEQEVPVEEQKRVVKEAEVHQLCARLGVGMGRAEVSAAFRKTAAPRDYLDFPAFQEFVKLLKRREEVEEIFRAVVGPAGAFTEEAWGAFLRGIQQLTINPDALTKSFLKYADRQTKRITLDGFGSYLMSSDNAALREEADQDMTRPISEYFISSSHNTYLVGNQFQGESTVEGYIRALQQGCRCVELDVWDGDDGIPIVTHGLTLTSKISVRQVLEAIAQYAFLASPYPVLLSMEVHCSIEQQDKLVEIMKTTLGERLVTKRVDELEGEVEKLPSPTELKGKILLKAKNKFVTTSNANGFPVALESSHDPSSSNESSSTSSDSDLKKVFRAVRQGVTSRPSMGSRSSRSSSSSTSTLSRSPGTSPTGNAFFATQNNRLSATVATSPPPLGAPLPPPPKEGAQSAALLSLLVYTVGVKARGFNKKETYAPTHVISVGEGSLTKMIKDEGARQDFVAHNRGHLTRAYPKGSRLTSSNYAPHHMWAVGVQMVALNWQTFDVGMELNVAMFARAARSGYVLKPELLRKKGAEKDKSALIRSERYIFELEIISAQQLPRPRDPSSSNEADVAPVDPFIEVSLYQPGLIAPIKKRTKVVMGNAFNPIFKSTFSIPFSCHPSPGMLDLVFLRLEVLNARGNIKSAQSEEGKGDFDFLGAYAISVGALLPGYRHVPLYDAFGDQHLFSTVFIKSTVVPTHSVG
ncbi:PLC-like phosphodiesterase [Leucosporidium creatinivorum]|uniref:Phosphoinositide phospholipase C n=1 Tax=Leucosporidium creatinivorum TaxID=106004 RepID=A0A1Y2BXL4_9BASI|nr:PLC-like phosphodiesterase [Leucosporidium creatinivorum]